MIEKQSCHIQLLLPYLKSAVTMKSWNVISIFKCFNTKMHFQTLSKNLKWFFFTGSIMITKKCNSLYWSQLLTFSYCFKNPKKVPKNPIPGATSVTRWDIPYSIFTEMVFYIVCDRLMPLIFFLPQKSIFISAVLFYWPLFQRPSHSEWLLKKRPSKAFGLPVTQVKIDRCSSTFQLVFPMLKTLYISI